MKRLTKPGIAASALFVVLAMPSKTIASTHSDENSEQIRYSIVDLGPVGAGTPFMISNDGFIAGFADPKSGAPQPPGASPQDHDRATYKVTDLGTLGGTFSDTGGVNNHGEVVGGATVNDDAAIHAFLWNGGVMTDLGTLGGPNSFANAVSNRTNAVGLSDISNSAGNPSLCFEEFVLTSHQCRAFLWEDGVMKDLGTLGGSSSAILGAGVNSRGQAVGAAETAMPDPNNPPFQIYHAFLWKDGEMKDLGTLGGPNSMASGISDSGRVVGQAETATLLPSCGCFAAHAFLWSDDAMSDLGTLGGNFSNALAINGRHQIVGGSSLTGDASTHAFIWEHGYMMTDLGTLPGDVFSIATDISSEGQVVGLSCDASGNCHGFTWYRGIMTDLNALIPAGSDLELVTAYQINSRGQINGTAVQKSTGQTTAYLATISRDEDASPAGGSTAQLSPRVTVSESVRNLLRQRLVLRYRVHSWVIDPMK